MAGFGFGAKEARYNTRLAKNIREQINLCGACGVELPATELLCMECRATLGHFNDVSDHLREASGD